MTAYFLDSSALLKRYIAEAGSQWIRSLTIPRAGHTLSIAQIAPIELMSGVSRQKREGRFTHRTARAIRLLIDRHVSREYLVISMTANITRHSIDLLELYPLRAFDAVQLAAALTFQNDLIRVGLAGLTFLSADNRLLSAASQEGLATDNPNNH